jgi:hypothetical protein
MVRKFLGAALAVLLAAVPAARHVCDLACVPAAAPMPSASHCASHAPEPAPAPAPGPTDRCGHDHHALLFVTAAPSAIAAPDLAIAVPHVHTEHAGPAIVSAVGPAARGGPSHAGRAPLNLRI